jgi:hypothetical protein
MSRPLTMTLVMPDRRAVFGEFLGSKRCLPAISLCRRLVAPWHHPHKHEDARSIAVSVDTLDDSVDVTIVESAMKGGSLQSIDITNALIIDAYHHRIWVMLV